MYYYFHGVCSSFGTTLTVLACENLHVGTVCIWRCKYARFSVEVFMHHICVHSIIQKYTLYIQGHAVDSVEDFMC